MEDHLRTNCSTACRLTALSFSGIVAESSFQIALLVELALIANALGAPAVAAYAAVVATVDFVGGIFNFFVTVTMSQVANALGAEAWADVASRFRVALLASAAVGVIAALGLLALEQPLFRLMGLTPAVRAAATEIYCLRVALLPLVMVQRVCVGLLVGFQCMRVAALRALLVALLEVASQWLALRTFNAGLWGAALGSVVAASIGVALSLGLVFVTAPRGVSALICCRCCRCQGSSAVAGGELTEGAESGRVSRAERADDDAAGRSALCDYWHAAHAVTVRSLLLSGSVWSMSVVASNVGAAALASHRIVLSLWMVTSYVCDGYANIGTMIGAKLIGARRAAEMRVLRNFLVAFGLTTGLLAAAALAARGADIIAIYTPRWTAHGGDAAAGDARAMRSALESVWPLLCGMQAVNALVFVYDGLMYATQNWAYVRNLMAVACILVYAPLLALGSALAPSLRAVWIAKAALNSVRFIGAYYLLHCSPLAASWGASASAGAGAGAGASAGASAGARSAARGERAALTASAPALGYDAVAEAVPLARSSARGGEAHAEEVGG